MFSDSEGARWSDGSYLEDQDQWWLSGNYLFSNFVLYLVFSLHGVLDQEYFAMFICYHFLQQAILRISLCKLIWTVSIATLLFM